jgi:hypothetical protein
MLDSVQNFVKVQLSQGYDASAVSVALVAGQGAKLPTVPFNMVWFNITDYPDPSDDPNAEIVRVTDRITDTLAITRAQESTSASTKNTAGKTYIMILGITAKMITDIGSNLHKPWNAPQVVSGTIDGVNRTFTLPTTPADQNSVVIYLAQQPQLLGIHFTISGSTITYMTAPDGSLAGLGHYAQYQ